MKAKSIAKLLATSSEQQEIILSFGETVSDITQAIFPEYENQFLKTLPIENNSRADRTALIVEWAIEFQKTHEKTEWDGEYLETVWQFVADKFKI